MEYTNLPAKAGKLINAVASIGYDTEVALCDLIDNSIDADASLIEVHLEQLLEEGEATNIISPYVIADNGIGMNQETIINALTLGSERDYPKGSLGKFGLGLKSAGLSLGSRLTIITKKEDSEIPLCAVLSIKDIEQHGEYRIKLGQANSSHFEAWEKYSIDSHGTVLIIDDVFEAEQTLSKFNDFFARYCGITYHMLIEESDLEIKVNGSSVMPEDPIHEQEALENGSLNPHAWDGKTVHLLLEEQNFKLSDDIQCKITATNLIHPPSFEDEESFENLVEEKREHYRIDTDKFTRRPRHGFYIYRNKRIIVMAERFHGLVSSATQAWAFRGRLMFDESADQILSLDVKKRHMKLPGNARNNLKILIENYQTKSINAWKLVGSRHSSNKNRDTVASQGISNTELNNLDYNPGDDEQTPEEKRQKTANLNKVSSNALKNIRDKNITKEEIIQKSADDHSIIYVDGIKGNPMWIPYAATKIKKAEVLLNMQHSWVEEATKIIEESPKSAMLLYQLFAILSRAELDVRTTPWKDVSMKDTEIILDKFRRKVSMLGEDVAISIEDAIKKIKQEMKDEE